MSIKTDLEKATLEVRDLRQILIEATQRMTSLSRVHGVTIAFNIGRPEPSGDFKLTQFSATKELSVD